MFMDSLQLPPNWFKVKISKYSDLINSLDVLSLLDTRDNLFINLHERLFSLTPVCHLEQLEFVMVSRDEVLPQFINRLVSFWRAEIDKDQTVHQGLEQDAEYCALTDQRDRETAQLVTKH